MSASITVRYFAMLRESAGKDSECLELATPQTPETLYRDLSHRYGFSLQPNQVRAAINSEFAPSDQALKPGDEIAFIPPVAGG